MTRRRTGPLRWAARALLVAAATPVVLVWAATPALADNCAALADCFAVAASMADAGSALALAAPLVAALPSVGGAPPAAAPATAEAPAPATDVLGALPVPAPRAGLLEQAVPAWAAADSRFVGLFATQGRQTYATVTVDGSFVPTASGAPVRDALREAVHQSGRVRRPGSDEFQHAEERLVDSGDLRRAVDVAARAGATAEPAVVRLVLNRTPCPDCARILADGVRQELARLSPAERGALRFELSARGPYEASEAVPAGLARYYRARTRLTDAATTTRDLRLLLDAGWDVRALAVDGRLTPWGRQLDEALGFLRGYSRGPA